MRQKVAAAPLEAHLGYWLRFVSNHVSHAFALKLERRGVTVAEWVVLRELFETEKAVPSALADRLGMTRGGISKLVDRLAAKSLLTRTADTRDRRYQSVALTSRGRALVPELSLLADRNETEFFGHLGAKERGLLASIMQDIVRRHGLRTVPVS